MRQSSELLFVVDTMQPVAKRGQSEMWEHFDLVTPYKVILFLYNNLLGVKWRSDAEMLCRGAIILPS